MTLTTTDADIIGLMELDLSLDGDGNCENPEHHYYAEQYLTGLLVHSDYSPVHWCRYLCPCGRNTLERRCEASIRFARAVGGFKCLQCREQHPASCMTDLGPVRPNG
jgi:hypothetical protein